MKKWIVHFVEQDYCFNDKRLVAYDGEKRLIFSIDVRMQKKPI